MSDPTVCAIMLTRDRPELAARAVECFRKQTYADLQFFGLDTGEKCAKDTPYGEPLATTVWMPEQCGKRTIGELRNGAIKGALGYFNFDIVVHWDDDDWSHPNRIVEQVELLQSSAADVVGYRDMLFWREGVLEGEGRACSRPSEAWLYEHQTPARPYALGTSLCYWRKTWERHHFANETQGVEDHWLREKKVVSVSAMGPYGTALANRPAIYNNPETVRMIARIHGGNTSNGYKLEEYVAKGSKEWKRVPEWDQRVRELLG